MKQTDGGVGIIEDEVFYPFAKGNLTTDGIQYSAANTTGADTDGYVAVEVGTIRLPDGVTLSALELGLTSAVYGSNTTGNIGVLWDISDAGVGFDALHTEVTSTSSTDIATPEEDTVSGIFNTTGGTNFTGAVNPFYVRCTVQSNTAGLLAYGKTKNSSYVRVKYRT